MEQCAGRWLQQDMAKCEPCFAAHPAVSLRQQAVHMECVCVLQQHRLAALC